MQQLDMIKREENSPIENSGLSAMKYVAVGVVNTRLFLFELFAQIQTEET